MSEISGRIRPHVLRDLRAMIAKEKGKDLYAIGVLDSDGTIESLRFFGKVSPKTFLGLFSAPEAGEIVLRTQSETSLLPTEDDDTLAKRFQEKGVGFFLLPPSLDTIRVLVEPPKDSEEIQLLDEEEVAAILGPDGPLARSLPGYEQRTEQIEMLRAVVRSFNHDQLLLVEAGTGTGKSLAYLIPAILWAKKNNEKVVVSTGTINLQEQIFQKDIPFLQKTLGLPFQAALVKGRNHYLCLRKLQHAQSEPTFFEDAGDPASWSRLLRWARQTRTGDRADLPFLPPDPQWNLLHTDAESCQKTRCDLYRSCFYYIAKRDQSQADILITNHHVLFADLAIRDSLDKYDITALLPPYRRVILDEAHNAEDAASSFLGLQVSPQGVLQSLGMLLKQNRRGEEIGLLRQISLLLLERSRQIPDAESLRERLLLGFLPQIKALKDKTSSIPAAVFAALTPFFADPANLPPSSSPPFPAFPPPPPRSASHPQGSTSHLQGSTSHLQGRGSIKQRITPALLRSGAWTALYALGSGWAEEIRDLLKALLLWGKEFEAKASGIEAKALHMMMDFSAAISRLGSASEMLSAFFQADPLQPEEDGITLIRWIEIHPDTSLCRFQAAPLDIGPDLERMLYQPLASVAFASATMATGSNDFSYICDRLGLSRQPPERLHTATFPSPFDYKHQSLIAIPTDLPSPKEKSFDQAILAYIFEALCASDGRAFVLSTSFQLLKTLHDGLAPRLATLGIRSLCQGHLPRSALLLEKINDPRSVLFGTDSFWEGVDVRGEALCNVILTRLPFRVPSDPLIEARIEALEGRGENSFLRYTVPAATIKFKQGFGRLIRSREDSGTVLILDKRVVEKSYGRQFLDSLPPECPRFIASAKETLTTLRSFHAQIARLRSHPPT